MKARAAEQPHARAFDIVRRHGRQSTSFQTLEHGFAYFFDGDALVAYRDTGKAWVAAGDPVASAERTGEVARSFLLAARRAHRRACFFGADDALVEGAELHAIRVGEEPVWDPHHWDGTLRASRSLREQLRRAHAKGVTTRRLHPEEVREESPLRAQLAELADWWLASRRMAPMGFLVQLAPFDHPAERIYLIAERDDEVVALLVAIPVYGRGGWMVEHILRDPRAPNGTTELLIDTLMRELRVRGVTYLTLGLAPLGGPVAWWLRAARRLGKPLYNFEGLHAFKTKLRPDWWESRYLAHPARRRALIATADALTAFAPGGVPRFALASIRHLRRPFTSLLAALLVPWTVALGLAGLGWFPSPAVKWAWVLFDSVLVALMALVLERWRRGLVTLLMLLTGADATLTLAQALLFNLRHIDHPIDLAVVLLSVLAPPTACAFFAIVRGSPDP